MNQPSTPPYPGDQTLPELTATELKQRLDNGDALCIIDIREPFEWDIGNLEQYGAVLLPMGQLAAQLEELDPHQETVVYCHTGRRSTFVVQQLRAAGFVRVWNLRGGIAAWGREVDPSMPEY
jgi:rhodanese-related sulfurtransferase